VQSVDIISSQGRVTYSGYPGLTLKYHTDFEDVIQIDAHALSLPIAHVFNFGDGGARMWMEENFGHSGKRYVGMEVTDVVISRRNEFNIVDMEKLVGDELFVSCWFYLPPDWSLHSPSTDPYLNWYSLACLFQEQAPNYAPYAALHIYQPDITKPIFNLGVFMRDVNQVATRIVEISNFPLPRGRWFNVSYYVLRHPTNGIIKVWVDGTLICDKSGLCTKVINEYFTTVAKIYYNTADTFSPYRVWVDDLEIYGKP
jgi:hypothetical protein